MVYVITYRYPNEETRYTIAGTSYEEFQQRLQGLWNENRVILSASFINTEALVSFG